MIAFPGAVEHLRGVLAHLRAQAMFYQTAHWQTHGPVFYGNHLLFERLYKSVLDQIDAIAEKMVGYYGPSSVDLFPQACCVALAIRTQNNVPDVWNKLLNMESEFQDFLDKTYKLFEANGSLPMGLDDWLMATASAHEENIYLLQQASGLLPIERRASLHNINHPLTAEGYFYGSPKKRETREFAESTAISNVVDVGADVAKSLEDDEVETLVDGTPLTPSEIVKRPGGKAISTLNRLVVDSSDKKVAPAVKANAPLMPKEAASMQAWLQELEE